MIIFTPWWVAFIPSRFHSFRFRGWTVCGSWGHRLLSYMSYFKISSFSFLILIVTFRPGIIPFQKAELHLFFQLSLSSSFPPPPSPTSSCWFTTVWGQFVLTVFRPTAHHETTLSYYPQPIFPTNHQTQVSFCFSTLFSIISLSSSIFLPSIPSLCFLPLSALGIFGSEESNRQKGDSLSLSSG